MPCELLARLVIVQAVRVKQPDEIMAYVVRAVPLGTENPPIPRGHKVTGCIGHPVSLIFEFFQKRVFVNPVVFVNCLQAVDFREEPDILV